MLMSVQSPERILQRLDWTVIRRLDGLLQGDYRNGLADITDAEFSRHYETIGSAINELIDSGQVKTGSSVVLDTVPIPFLQHAPLLNRKWLDHHEALLAEVYLWRICIVLWTTIVTRSAKTWKSG